MVLAHNDKGGLGVSSLFALNRGLMFKWIWRFYAHDTSLWVRVIMVIYGEAGNMDAKVKAGSTSCWMSIVHEAKSLVSKGIDLFKFMRFKLGNGENARFWEDRKEPMNKVSMQIKEQTKLTHVYFLIGTVKGYIKLWEHVPSRNRGGDPIPQPTPQPISQPTLVLEDKRDIIAVLDDKRDIIAVLDGQRDHEIGTWNMRSSTDWSGTNSRDNGKDRTNQAENPNCSDRQKSYADLKRKPMDFEVRDRVMLKVPPWKRVVRFVMPLEGIHVNDRLQFVEEPVEIMEQEIKRLKRSWIPLVKVRWNSRRGTKFTWENED
nr:RNA-directed DNA polymerase, eukaryota, reverse transcriptase zinc-binding domain protein [Tanacetum cinerariifolium]